MSARETSRDNTGAIWCLPVMMGVAWLWAGEDFVLTHGIWCIVAGCAAAGLLPYWLGSVWRCERAHAFAEYLLAACAGLAVGLVFPWPYAAGGWAFFAGSLCGMAGRRQPFQALAGGLLRAGMVWLVQAATMISARGVMGRWHEADGVQAWVIPILRWAGLDAVGTAGAIRAVSFDWVLSTPETLERWGVYPLALIGAGCLVTLRRVSVGTLAWLAGIIAVYAFLRQAVVTTVFMQMGLADVFWRPEAVAASYVPLAAVLWRLVPAGLSGAEKVDTPRLRRLTTVILGVVVLFAGSGAVYLWGPDHAGPRKAGRILIDESHSDWEWSTQPFDTTWYGGQSTYNYYCLSRWLGYHYDVKAHEKGALDAAALAGCDVLVIKTPTRGFTPEEQAAIAAFVQAGGGLWLIGDHTNVFGTSHHLNPLAKRFGLAFRYDSTYDLEKGTLTFWKPPRLFAHPTVAAIPHFLFATSCTLVAPWDILESGAAMLGYRLRSRNLAYSERAFFENKPLQDYGFGLYLQAATARYGQGRVLAFADSTCFSNFYMHLPGKPELALGSVEWLNHRSAPALPRYGLLALMLLLGPAAYVLLRRNAPLAAPAVCLLGVTLSCHFLAQPGGGLGQTPRAIRPYETMAWLEPHSAAVLPQSELTDTYADNFHTFYVWFQRKALVPRVCPDLLTALAKNDMAVLALPDMPLAGEEIAAVRSFLERGGRLVVLGDASNSRRAQASNVLLTSFGMRFMPDRIGEGTPAWSGNNPGNRLRGMAIEGGAPLLTLSDGTVSCAVQTVGKGRLYAVGFGQMFTNSFMGGTQMKPTPHQTFLYGLEFQLIDHMRIMHQ